MNRRQQRGKKASIGIAIFLALLVACIPLTHAALLNLTYDANGNLVTGDGKYRTYNSKNQLVSIRDGNTVSDPVLQTYVHHPTQEKMLVKKTYWSNGTLKETVTYISDEFVRVVNSSGTHNTTYYFDANADLIAQKNPDGTITTLLNDIEGSANVATNVSGAVTERTTYEPFGAVQAGGTTTRYTYEGKEADAVAGDIDFEFRKYNPEWGIFTQPDDVINNVYEPQELNRYSFEKNNPYKYEDPDGHNPVYAGAFAIGFAFGAVSYGWNHMGEGRGSLSNFGGYMARGIGHGIIGGAVGVGTVAFATSGGRIAATAGGSGFLRGTGMALVGAGGYVADQALEGEPIDYGDMAIAAGTNAMPTGVHLQPGSFVSSRNPLATNSLKLAQDQFRGNVMNLAGQSYLTYVSGGSNYGAAVTNTILDRPGVQLNRGGHSAKYEIKTSTGGRYPTNNANWRPRPAGTPGGKGGGSSFGGR